MVWDCSTPSPTWRSCDPSRKSQELDGLFKILTPERNVGLGNPKIYLTFWCRFTYRLWKLLSCFFISLVSFRRSMMASFIPMDMWAGRIDRSKLSLEKRRKVWIVQSKKGSPQRRKKERRLQEQPKTSNKPNLIRAEPLPSLSSLIRPCRVPSFT